MNSAYLLNKAKAADEVIKKALSFIHGGAEIDLDDPITEKMVTALHNYQNKYFCDSP